MSSSLPKSLLLLPYPAFVEMQDGRYRLPSPLTVYADASSAHDEACRQELGARIVGNAAKAAVRMADASLAPRSLASWARKPEGYALRIEKDGVDIWAATDAGRLYGVMSLVQLIRQYGSAVPCLVMGDAPCLSRRGVQLSFPQGHTAYRHHYMMHLVPQLARLKINELYLYLESYFDFPSLPHMAGPEAMTPDDARDLDRLCREYNITLIPMLNVLAHCGEILATQRYAHLREHRACDDQRTTRPFNLCATSKETHRLVDGMLDDLYGCFSAEMFHIGGDEVSCLGECPRCLSTGTTEPLSLYLAYFQRVLKEMAKHGRRGGIWGDMLLHYAPNLSATESRKVFADLRENAIIYDWAYSGGSPDSLTFFTKAKLDTIACTSTHLCYSSAMWPSQAGNQRAFFLDAIGAGIMGGMTTAWGNFTGLQEEQFNYLHASTATLLWSGAEKDRFVASYDMDAFDKAYRLQRYGLKKSAFTDYLHAVGDAGGPILSLLQPQQGLALRKCLYHTDNPLLFWDHYASILSHGNKLKRYAAAIAKTRKLWIAARAEEQALADADPCFALHEGPLVMHEHLLARYQMTEQTYAFYDKAASVQYEKPADFRKLLDQAAAVVLEHLQDFAPVDAYLALGRKTVGFDRSTLNRIAATKKNIRYLAEYLRHLKKSHRPLPAFHELHLFLLSQPETAWYGDREHEWAAESPKFRRYSLTTRNVCNSVVAFPHLEIFRKDRNCSEFVGGWRLSPVTKTTGAPERVPAKRKVWKTLPAGPDGFVNIHDVTKEQDGTVFLTRRFRVDADGTWVLRLGHDGGAKLFIDGKPVLHAPQCLNPARADRSTSRVTLKKGIHEVVVAFDLCGGKGWGFFFQWKLVGKQDAPVFPVPVE